jgi:hypothetical protein
MFGYAARAAGLGAAFGAATSLVVGICFSVVWVRQSGGFVGWYLLLLPPFAIAGAIAGCCIFAIAGSIVYAIRRRHVPIVFAYTLLGGLLSLPLLLYWASWVAGGMSLALGGAKGVYGILFPGLLAMSVAGAFVGRWMQK